MRGAARVAAAAVALAGALAACSSDDASTTEPVTPDGTTVSTQPAVTPQAAGANTTLLEARIAAPNGRTAPAPAASPAELAQQIVVAERGLHDASRNAAQLAELGHLQEVAYRKLSIQPTWDGAVLAALPSDLVATVNANMRARRAFFEIKSGYADTVPAWEIVTPAPAETLLAFYKEAERATGIGWQYLAAINFIETGFGRIRGLSTAGAQGPMQFIASTWNESGIGKGDINDPHDAIQAAARYLVRRGGPADMRKALFGYNNHNAYVDGVTAYADMMKADERAFIGFYNWEIYFSTADGDLWFPAGVYREPNQIKVVDYKAKSPWSITGLKASS
ncbi:MAG: lytic transglycosylase domain-containing protein [Acidimicrobiales bacterium]